MHLSKTDRSPGLSAALLERTCISLVPELCQPNFLSILLLYSSAKFLGVSGALQPLKHNSNYLPPKLHLQSLNIKILPAFQGGGSS